MVTEAEFRIASLVPSLTETLFALGLGSQVVARTGYCIYPAQGVKAVPKVGGTKTVNFAKLERLNPSHVLLNYDENTLATLHAVQAFRTVPQVVNTHPQAPLDNLPLYRQLGKMFDVTPAADALCERFQGAYDSISTTKFKPLKVLYLIWAEPYMTVASNTYVSQTLALFGLQTMPTAQGEVLGASRYPSVGSAAELAACVANNKVDCVLLSTEPYAFNAAHSQQLALQLGVPVHLIDGELTSWYGSRAIAALPALAAWRSLL